MANGSQQGGGKFLSGSTALTSVNSITNQFSRTASSKDIGYETDPLISGMFFCLFELPSAIFNSNNEPRGASDRTSAASILAATNVSIELPEISIDPVKIDGLGGTFIQVPGKLTIGDTVTTNNWETSNAEITSVIRQWLFTIRDPVLGVARVGNNGSPAGSNSKYKQTAYKGSLYYALTDPNMDRVMLAIEFFGIWPKNLPLNSLNSNITTNDKVEVSTQFAFDKPFMYSSTAQYASAQILAKRFQEMIEVEKAAAE